jgi:L-cysteate sulfo-lyase
MFERLAAALQKFPRAQLLDGPTPIQRLERLERSLPEAFSGLRLFVKRDDLMGLGGGGNKLRKLEFTIGEAVARHCDAFVTVGGTQSNHARLSAAASARAGLSCDLVLTRAVPRNDDDYARSGNVMLDHLFGATVHELPKGAEADRFVAQLVSDMKEKGRRPYVVGTGGSSPIGCLGYAACASEIVAQESALGIKFTRIIAANGSSGTHAGLAAGFKVLGMDPARIATFTVLATAGVARSATLDLARRTIALIDAGMTVDAAEIVVAGDQLGEGYGIPTDAMLAAVRRMARTEGLLLDPVYTGKAFAGVLAELERGVFKNGDSILFVMTGGTPGLFAYRSTFS